MICPKCGKQFDEGQRFCSDCGVELVGQTNMSGAVQDSQSAMNPSHQERVSSGAGNGSQQKPEAPKRSKSVAVIIAVAFIVAGYLGGKALGGLFADSVSGNLGSNDPEQVIRTSVESGFDDIRNASSSDIEKLAAENEQVARELALMGIGPQEFFSAVIEGFGGQVDSIELGESTGSVQVTIKHKDLSRVYDNLDSAFEEAQAAGTISEDATESELYEWLGKAFLAEVRKAPLKESQCTLKVMKKGDAWDLDAESWKNDFARLLWGESVSF